MELLAADQGQPRQIGKITEWRFFMNPKKCGGANHCIFYLIFQRDRIGV